MHRPSATERADAVKEQVSRTHEVGLAAVGRGIHLVDLSPATADVKVAPSHGVGLAGRHRAVQILDDARGSPAERGRLRGSAVDVEQDLRHLGRPGRAVEAAVSDPAIAEARGNDTLEHIGVAQEERVDGVDGGSGDRGDYFLPVVRKVAQALRLRVLVKRDDENLVRGGGKDLSTHPGGVVVPQLSPRREDIIAGIVVVALRRRRGEEDVRNGARIERRWNGHTVPHPEAGRRKSLLALRFVGRVGSRKPAFPWAQSDKSGPGSQTRGNREQRSSYGTLSITAPLLPNIQFSFRALRCKRNSDLSLFKTPVAPSALRITASLIR
jgi:hypothetical protein